MKTFLALLCGSLTVSVAQAAPHTGKLTCAARELARQDCRLTSGEYNLRLLERTIAWSDGTWHTVDPMPLTGEGIEWEKVQFSFMDNRPIVQMWLWDKAVGEAHVQSLHWYVADAEKRKFTILAEGIVRKRHLKTELTPAEVAAPPPTVPVGKNIKPYKPKYLYDEWETHNLKPLKNGALEWTLGRQKKIIEKVSHGI